MSTISRLVLLFALVLTLFSGRASAGEKTCEKFAKKMWSRWNELDKEHSKSPIRDALKRAGMSKYYNVIRKKLVSKNHPRRLEFARKKGKLVSTLGRTWITPEPIEFSTVEVHFHKLGGKGKASVTVYELPKSAQAKKLWELIVKKGDENKGKKWKKTITSAKGKLLAVVVDGKSVGKSIEYELRIFRPGQGKLRAVKRSSTKEVKGFADLHAHHMAHLAFGGQWVWPAPWAKLASCDGKSHGRLPYKESDWRGGKHVNRTKPFTPKAKGAWLTWPHHLCSAHQMMHAAHLKEARKNGLRLLVASAVNNQFLSAVVTKKKDYIPHDDMDSVKLQIRAMHAFAKKYPWYRIAHDPWEARRIINDGDIAVIIAVEVSNLMPNSHGNWRDQLDVLYDMGVRSMEITHETDGDFSGAALQHGFIFKLMQRMKHPVKFKTIDKNHNAKGLTKAGKELLRKLAAKKMLFEIDHCSRKARDDVWKMVGSLDYYPIFFSHSRYDELMPSKAQVKKWLGITKGEGTDAKEDTQEYMARNKDVAMVMKTGGVFGLRTGPNAQKTYGPSGVDNRCHTSSRSFAQLVAYGQKYHGVAQSLGSDIMGFVPTLGARFGKHAGSCLPRQKGDNPKTDKPTGTDFDNHGLKHIGLEGALITDLENLGLDVSDLRRSAETFLRMWQRCYESKRGPMTKNEYKKYFFQK